MFESKKKIEMWVSCGDDYYYGQNGEKVDYEMAAIFYGKAEAKKHPRATFMLALCYEQGKGVDKDEEYAELLYEKAAKLGDADAQNRLKSGKAVMAAAPVIDEEELRDAIGEAVSDKAEEDVALALQYFLKKKYKKALPLMRQLAEKGNAEAQYYLGLMYVGGNGVAEDFEEAAEWFKKSALQGNTDARESLNTLQGYESALQEYDKSERAFAKYDKLCKAAEKGDASAAYRLGVMCEKGIGAEADQSAAFSWYSDASDCGTKSDARARLAVAYMYYEGRGTERNYAEAYNRFGLANGKIFGQKEQRFPEAYYMRGLMDKDGKGTAKSIPMALHHFRMAADDGHADAHYELAMLYRNSAETDDLKAAILWMEKAAALKQPDAVRCLRTFKADAEKALAEAAARDEREEQEAIKKMNEAIQLEHSEEYEKALALYRQIAKIEKPFAVASLAAAKIGLFYGQGQGVPYDYKLAHSWFVAAKKRGYENADEALGNLEEYEGMRLAFLGRDAGQDIDAGNYMAAKEKLTQVAPILRDKDRYEVYTGHMIKMAVDCAYLLGNLSAGGQGGPVNYNEARMWYSLAIQEGDAGAADMLKNVNEMERLDRERQRLR